MMRPFTDEAGAAWIATAREEQSPRHHTRWYLVFHPEGDDSHAVPLAEVRWQTFPTATRTLRTMSVFELRRRLEIARQRAAGLNAESAPV
jgi:hypothetical protein